MKKEVLPANKFENIYRCGEVTSTMDVCEELIKSGVGRGIVVAAEETAVAVGVHDAGEGFAG